MSVYGDARIGKMVLDNIIIGENFEPSCLTPNGYDLRVSQVSLDGENVMDKADVPPASHFLVSTLEYIVMPDDLMGQIWIRSSYARRGVIGSFGAVDAGFHGNLTLSFFNASMNYVSVRQGERIAQLVIHELKETSIRSYAERSGNYQGSRGVTVKGKDRIQE